MDNSHELKKLSKNKKLLKFLVNKLITLGDLNSELDGIDSSVGNINCPFHPIEKGSVNRSRSAKVYLNEENGAYFIKCFTTGNSYYAYDYITLLLEEDPYDYLLKHRNKIGRAHV